jgi:hypothetical protein
MKIRTFAFVFTAVTALAFVSLPASAQITRESNTKSLAGVLRDTINPVDSFAFFSRGGEVVLADIDSDIFQMHGRMGGDHGEETTHTTEAGEVTDGHTSGDGCADDAGGPDSMCLQVTDGNTTVFCHAGRPMRPGWQRDPALVCPLPKTQVNTIYVLSVKLGGGCGQAADGFAAPAGDVDATTDGAVLYVLDFSVRGLASDGHLEAEVAKSLF